jgi:hypothetical protein
MRGAPARAIQEIPGHEDLSSTQSYLHLSAAAVDSAIRLLDGDEAIECVEKWWRRRRSPGRENGVEATRNGNRPPGPRNLRRIRPSFAAESGPTPRQNLGAGAA